MPRRRPGSSSHLSPLAVRVAGGRPLALGAGGGRAAALRPRPAGAVRGAAAGLALRARVPDRGRHHDAAVPAQALRRPPHPPLPVRALAVSVHLHQDLGVHPRRAGPGRARSRTQVPGGPGGAGPRGAGAGPNGGGLESRAPGAPATWARPGKARPSECEGAFEARHRGLGPGGRWRWVPVLTCVSAPPRGGHVLRGGVHPAGSGLEHLRLGHRAPGHHHGLHRDRCRAASGRGGLGGEGRERAPRRRPRRVLREGAPFHVPAPRGCAGSSCPRAADAGPLQAGWPR